MLSWSSFWMEEFWKFWKDFRLHMTEVQLQFLTDIM